MATLELLVVVGYIRRNIQSIDSANGIIPIEIKTLCSKYYDYLPVFLQKGEDMAVHNEDMAVLQKGEDHGHSTVIRANGNPNWNSAYGVLKINSMEQCIYEWTLKINKLDGNLILLGLVDFDGDHSVNMITEHDLHYVLNGCGVLREHRKSSKRLFNSECSTGTVIIFRLDLHMDPVLRSTPHIQMLKDGADLGVIFPKVTRKEGLFYKFGVSFYEKGSSVSFVSLEKILPKSAKFADI